MSKLALLGGKPVINYMFPKNSTAGDCETNSIIEVLKDNEFSRYAGGPSNNVEDLLKIKSKYYNNINFNYWNFLGGKKVREFEKRFSEYYNIDYSIAVNSATSGLIASLKALNIGVGDEVITTCMTFTATSSAISGVGATPVFVDVDEDTLCINPTSIEKGITEKTKCILIVHLGGFTADMNPIMEIAKKNKLFVIEDCAQSPGVYYKDKLTGTIGDIGVFSFQETKNIMTGEGGMIITNNENLARRCRLIRNHGESIDNEILGFNFRMTELTAALGICQLEKLNFNNKIRRENCNFLIDSLEGYDILKLPNKEYIPHFFALQYLGKEIHRNVFINALNAEGLRVTPGYPRLLHKHPIYENNIYPNITNDCHIAEELYDNKCIWLFEIYPPINKKILKDIVKVFKKVINNLDDLKSIKNKEIENER